MYCSRWLLFVFISLSFLSANSFSFVSKYSSRIIISNWYRTDIHQRSILSTRISRRSFSSSSSHDDGTFKQQHSNDEGNTMLVLGICGGIASGKSKACQILVSHPEITNCILGYVDADQLAHSLYDNNNSSSPSVLLQQILREFGPTVFVSNNTTSSNLQLDRKALGNIVFSNPERMSALEQIVWPQLKMKLVEQLRNYEQQHRSTKAGTKCVVVVEAAMMLEAGWDDLLDAVWVLRSPHQKQFLVQHRLVPPDEATTKIQAQSHRRGMVTSTVMDEVANGFVTAIIDNDGDIDTLTQRLLNAWNDPTCWKRTKNGQLPP